MTLLLAGATLHASLARADDEATPPTAPSGAVASDDGEGAAEPTATPATVAAPEAPSTTANSAKPGRPADPIRLAQIGRDLALVRDEETSTSRLLPILTITLGVAAVATAATVGAVQALSCSDTCHAGGWQGVTVIGGAAVATLGVLWLRWTNDDLRELGSRRYRLERERDDIGASIGEPRSARPTRPQAWVLGVRGRF